MISVFNHVWAQGGYAEGLAVLQEGNPHLGLGQTGWALKDSNVPLVLRYLGDLDDRVDLPREASPASPW